MTTSAIIQIIVAALGGGGFLAAVLQFVRGRGSDVDTKTQAFLDMLLTRVEALEKENKRLSDTVAERDKTNSEQREELKRLRETVEALEAQLQHYEDHRTIGDAHLILEQLMNALPHPAWIVDLGTGKWYLSDSYSVALNVPRREFWTPLNVMQDFPSEVRNKYYANDLRIVQSGIPQSVFEPVCKNVLQPESPDNPSTPTRVLKIPISCGGNDYLVGIAYMPDERGRIHSLWDAFSKSTFRRRNKTR